MSAEGGEGWDWGIFWEAIKENINQFFRTSRVMPSTTSISLTGDFIPNFAATTAVAGVIMEKPSLGEHISKTYIAGSGSRLKRFNTYANRPGGYKSKLGFRVSCYARWGRGDNNFLSRLEEAFKRQGLYVQYVHEDIITYRDVATKWIAENFPHKADQEFGISIQGDRIQVAWADYTVASFLIPTGTDAPGTPVLAVGYLSSPDPLASFIMPDVSTEDLYEEGDFETGKNKKLAEIPWGPAPPEGFSPISWDVLPEVAQALFLFVMQTFTEYEFLLYVKQENITKMVGGLSRKYLKQQFWTMVRAARNTEADEETGPSVLWISAAGVTTIETPLTQTLWGGVQEVVVPLARLDRFPGLGGMTNWDSDGFLPPVPVRTDYRMLKNSPRKHLWTPAKTAAYRATGARMKTFTKVIEDNLNEWQKALDKDGAEVPENKEEELDNLAGAADPKETKEEPRDITPEEAKKTVERGTMVSLVEAAYLEFGIPLNSINRKDNALYIGRFFKRLGDEITGRASETELQDDRAQAIQKTRARALTNKLEKSYEEWMEKEIEKGILDPMASVVEWSLANLEDLDELGRYEGAFARSSHSLTFLAGALDYSYKISWDSVSVTVAPNIGKRPVGDYAVECGNPEGLLLSSQYRSDLNDLKIRWWFSPGIGITRDLTMGREVTHEKLKDVSNEIRYTFVDSPNTIVTIKIDDLVFYDRARGTEVMGIEALWEKQGAAFPFIVPIYMPVFNSLGMKRKTQVALNCANMRMHYRTVYIDTYLETFLLRPIEFLSLIVMIVTNPIGAVGYFAAENDIERNAVMKMARFANPTAMLATITNAIMVRGLQSVFGKKWGAVIGIVLGTGLMALAGGGFSIWNIINAIISATTAGIQRYYEESAKESQEALQRYMVELEEGWKEMFGSAEENSKKDFYGEVMVKSLQTRRPETPMEFLTMSFLSGDDIAQLGAKYIEHYTELSLDLKREVSF